MADAVRRDIRQRHGSPWEPAKGAVTVEFAAWLLPHVERIDRPDRADDPAIWHGAGDVDKLARNLLDALADDARVATYNGGAYANDNQVVHLIGSKFTAHDTMPPGMWIRVCPDDNPATRRLVLEHYATMARYGQGLT